MIITGTDTNVGKTVVAAMLTLGLGVNYFKPIQCGTHPETDIETVRRLTGLGADRILDPPITLSQPLSPHLASELDGVTIDADTLRLPKGRVIVEGAGGLMVPVTRKKLFIDLFAAWQRPVVLVARTGLGTLNHTLLSLEALRARKIEILGVVFVGEENPDNMKTIEDMGTVKVLGRVPILATLDANNLNQVFKHNFNKADFESKL